MDEEKILNELGRRIRAQRKSIGLTQEQLALVAEVDRSYFGAIERGETSKLAAFTPEEVETIFGDKIKQQVSEQIQAQATELTANVADTGRKNELHSGLSMLLEQFLQRIERGMTVEIRLIGQHDIAVESEAGEDGSARNDLETLAAELTFPPASAAPVLKLSGGASDVERRTATRSTRASPSPKKTGPKASESKSKSD